MKLACLSGATLYFEVLSSNKLGTLARLVKRVCVNYYELRRIVERGFEY